MPLRHAVRILFCAAMAGFAGIFSGALLLGWLIGLSEAVDWGDAAASMVYMPFAALVYALYFFPTAFPAAFALAAVAGGLLWHFGRARAWARRRTSWLAAGAVCGLIEAASLLLGNPPYGYETLLLVALPGAAAGAAASLLFRAAMPLLPPYTDGGEDGGWDL